MNLRLHLTEIEHTWITDQLNELISISLPSQSCQLNDNEKIIVQQLMENAYHCKSAHELWTISSRVVPLAMYNLYLPPWFHGLDLVRFEHTSQGQRHLQIIV